MYKDITGIILSGGKSSRMGTNKSLLKIGSKTAIEIISNLMQSIFEKNILSTNSPEEYEFLKLPMVKDVYKNAGPLAGIHAALSESLTERNFIISCDVPMMSREMIEYLAEYNSEKDIIICRAVGFLQPLVGIYKKSTLQLIDSILSEDENHLKKKSNHLSLHALIEQANTNILDVTSLPFYSANFFFNINTKEDYEKTKINFLTF